MGLEGHPCGLRIHLRAQIEKLRRMLFGTRSEKLRREVELAEALLKQREQDAAIAAERKTQVGTGDRSERIRTYNFPQGRVSDHRIGLTLYKLDSFLNGDMDEIINALISDAQAKLLAHQD